MQIGAHYQNDDTCKFVVWAPFKKQVSVRIDNQAPISMRMDEQGYWSVAVDDVCPGSEYIFLLDQQTERPDPASFFQPRGVHNPSAVVDHSFYKWHDSAWLVTPMEKWIIYELHVGAFTPGGTFEAIIEKLDYFKALGINAIELMPVAQFPGDRNWGYDGVHPFAVQTSYGGPNGLKQLVDSCHILGIAVILDVVYNHLGPEGNYLHDFGPYFKHKYKTPWGEAINFDDAWSDGVRNYFIQNALYWFEHFHIDALRLDAVHAIYDFSARPFLQQLAQRVEEFSVSDNRNHYLIAESDLNDTRIIRSREAGGFAIDAQWSDDFHHAIHTLLTRESTGYYMDFGDIGQLHKALTEGFVYSGEYSKFRKRRHGNSATDIPANQFVVCVQNHDQIGNRMLGERLASLAPVEALKLAAGLLFTSPYIPLLFMGEEYGETSPFLYFVSHNDPNLIKDVREGRRLEFKDFKWQTEPPDPQDVNTFMQSKLDWNKQTLENHSALYQYYRQLIQMRMDTPALANLNNKFLKIYTQDDIKVFIIHRWYEKQDVFILLNFNNRAADISIKQINGNWMKVFDSSEERWGGPGEQLPAVVEAEQKYIIPAFGFAVYRKQN
ncbi:malto-oligosyltrehalose trehalohydrolase [candidate division KSB1 bacterium]|nr:malto-oligosyltrehalose trehalohydrolase [candidate division KSB1 bacterium]